MTYGYWQHPPPPPPRRPSRTAWILIGCTVAIVFAVSLVLVIHALSPSPPRPQDNQSYQFGYTKLGPRALSAVNAGAPASAACEGTLLFSGDFHENPSWLDSQQATRGCLDYINQTHPSYGPSYQPYG